MGKFVISKRTNGEFQFKLTATNSQIVGTSQMYASLISSDNGIASVKANASGATIEDQVA
jgi:uncharacterized protein